MASDSGVVEDVLASGPSLQQAFAAFVLSRQTANPGADTKAAVAAAGKKAGHKRKAKKKAATGLGGTSSKPGSPPKSPGGSRKGSRPGSSGSCSSGSSKPGESAGGGGGGGPKRGSPRRPKSPASLSGTDAAGSNPTRPKSATAPSTGAITLVATSGAGPTRPRSPHYSSPGSPLSPSTEERRARLRAQFLELARSFIGVPYGKRYHEPGNCACEGCSSSGRQLYHEPLFLDCCGLVRKAARALQRQLGFRLGPGNQAYQFDTLPVRMACVAELRPGDLIFYSGTPYSPDARRYAFDMTHVEIFVGGTTGEATLGSRERYKWVMEYDSYRFTSQRWALSAHHFCSIDPWLDGVCAPQHPELWSTAGRRGGQQGQGQRSGGSRPSTAGLSWNARKYSIFGGAAAAAEVGSRGGSHAKAKGDEAAASLAAATTVAAAPVAGSQQDDDGESDGQEG
ncbi:hypothetical protein HXX76_001944 [Chlamydomonas incerta]|uniref:NlpC/P60 domain-containing protein n=1 Tax=Chlamydomonas incerta TaxID=51695 RepID=A0A835WA47_CHLIN|nr:hypothetical protein HXX76_001944 [Chlamydomonas incerta]|eukprot:KAG2443593.1 hypothetical protein HXX76_001944 [Chlamydomonas incerta]